MASKHTILDMIAKRAQHMSDVSNTVPRRYHSKGESGQTLADSYMYAYYNIAEKEASTQSRISAKERNETQPGQWTTYFSAT